VGPLSQAVLLDINPKEKVGQAMAIWGAGIMVGPILGPVLGGWLTENTNWRWVFFINLPVGIFAFYGIARYLPENKPAGEQLDIFGLTTLSLAVGLLQMFLDRGEQQDWFNSLEICAEAIGCAVALAFFIAHTLTTNKVSFLNRELLKDRNFITGTAFAFVVGMILYATMALLPALLQGLLGYPVIYTGEIMAPRGLGTMLAMLVVGKMFHRIDLRAIMAFGFCLTAYSLYQMTHITLEMNSTLVTVSGFIQGMGIGFTFVPLSAVTFATLAPGLRNEGTPVYSLMRNVGSSVGISIVQAMLTESMARAHAELSVDINYTNQLLQSLPPAMNPSSVIGLENLNMAVNRQAAMIAYVGDFRVMMWLSLMTMPLLLLIRPAEKKPPVVAKVDGT
jgi:DHA2 family multidrug resistance protein